MNKWLLLTVIGLAAGTAYGFLPEEWPVSNPAPGSKAAVAAARIVQPSSAQLQAAGQLADAEIQWDRQTGAPLSVRAKMLGTLNLGGKGLKAAGNGNFAGDAIAVLDSLSAVYAVQDAQKEFAVLRVEADNIGFHHARVRQLHRGLRVVGAQVIVHFNRANQAYQVNGRYVPGITINTTPALTAEQAAAKAQADLLSRGKPEGALQGTPELVVYAEGGAAKLAFELILTYPAAPGGIPGRWLYAVDALTGQILNAFNSIPAADASISGNRLAGEGGASVNVTGTLSGGLYYLQHTLWLIHNADTTGSFTDSNSDARRSTASWGVSDTIEMSGAYNFSAIQNYFSTVHSRNSYNNAGAQATVNVHQEYGVTYNNAYWDPSVGQFFFFDGDGASLNGLTVTDVAAHEFTHAVTTYTADLVYQNEPGALNESFSDIFGALVEFYFQPDGRSAYPDKTAGSADWLLAEDAEVSQTAMRDMRNPSRYSQPSKYNGTSWYTGSQDNGGVHINSGVQNFFFYLLCEGGSGSNDGTSYDLTGIGFTNAARVAFRALTVYCTANTDYSAVRSAWVSAATDIDSSLVSAVEAAWDAVGVSAGGGGGGGGGPTERYTPLMYDYDGDYYGDPTIYDSVTGYWYIRLSGAGYNQVSGLWGGSGYQPLAGYFDNDWSYDPTIYDSSSGNWFMLLSTYNFDSYAYLTWGGGSMLTPVCGDFDGDLYADPTVYAQSVGIWHILMSSYEWEAYYALSFSAPVGFLPFMGDFDGDGWGDPTFYDPDTGYWYFLLSSTNLTSYDSLWFGLPGYTPTFGDFDGDLRADPIVRSSAGVWYVLLSSSGYQNYIYFSW
ncbi:MAG: M4 family metallopeptidase [Lentisphaerae bacterium]|nr:M4 family metallopeptidase [Lentisphaerota bacterium]